MSTSNPFGWFPGWGADRAAPLSGDVSQWFKIFSPTVTVNGRGEPELEARIVRDVATYGAQLGPLTQVVLAMAGGAAPPADELDKLIALRKAGQPVSGDALAQTQVYLDAIDAAIDLDVIPHLGDSPEVQAALKAARAVSKLALEIQLYVGQLKGGA